MLVGAALAQTEGIETVAFPIRWMAAADVADVLGELFGPSVRLEVDEASNTLSASATSEVLAQVKRLLRPEPGPIGPPVRVYPLVHVGAEVAQKRVMRLHWPEGEPVPKVVADEATQSLVVVGSLACQELIVSRMASIDR